MGRPRRHGGTASLTLDAGALIALDRGQARVIALLDRAVRAGARFHVPAGALAQAWRDGARQARLARFLANDSVETVPLDDALARAAGELCGALGTPDVIDASVVLCARSRGGVAVTSDASDLRVLDPSLVVFEV